MYIGSTDGRGLHALPLGDHRQLGRRGAGRPLHRIEVVLHADGSAEVRDNGRGIPVDIEPKTGLTGVELVMTRLHAGGKFGGGSYTASGGLHGVGASVVNALSARLDVEVDRERARVGGQLPPRRARRVRRRRPRRAVHAGARACARSRRVAKTRDRHPDPVLAGPAGVPRGRRSGQLRQPRPQRARQTAYLVPGLAIVVRDDRPPATGPGPTRRRRRRRGPLRRRSEAEFRFDGGISEFCEHLSPATPVTERAPADRRRASSPRPCRCSTTRAT